MKKIILMLLMLSVIFPFVNGQLYNTTNITNARDPYEQAVGLNQVTDGLLGFGFIIMAFVITFAIVSEKTGGDSIAALGAASFWAAVTSVMILPLGLIGLYTLQVVVVLCGIGILLSIWIGNRR